MGSGSSILGRKNKESSSINDAKIERLEESSSDNSRETLTYSTSTSSSSSQLPLHSSVSKVTDNNRSDYISNHNNYNNNISNNNDSNSNNHTTLDNERRARERELYGDLYNTHAHLHDPYNNDNDSVPNSSRLIMGHEDEDDDDELHFQNKMIDIAELERLERIERLSEQYIPANKHHHHHHHHHNSNRGGGDDDDMLSQASDAEEDDHDLMNNDADDTARMFASTTMSLDMDNEDLLFNLLYFGGDTTGSSPGEDPTMAIGRTLSAALEETVAAHSASNTPYKLNPANNVIISKLDSKVITLTQDNFKDGPHALTIDNHTTDEIECVVCKDMMEIEQQVVLLPRCHHCFHKDCILKWIQFQDWCPFCRTSLEDKRPKEGKNEINPILKEEGENEKEDNDNNNDNNINDVDTEKDELLIKKFSNHSLIHNQHHLNPAADSSSNAMNSNISGDAEISNEIQVERGHINSRTDIEMMNHMIR